MTLFSPKHEGKHPLTRKIWFFFGTLLTILSLLGFLSVWIIHQLNAQLTLWSHTDIPRKHMLLQVETGLSRYQTSLHDYLDRGSPNSLKVWHRMEDMINRTNSQLQSRSGVSAHAKKLLSRANQEFTRAHQQGENLILLADELSSARNQFNGHAQMIHESIASLIPQAENLKPSQIEVLLPALILLKTEVSRTNQIINKTPVNRDIISWQRSSWRLRMSCWPPLQEFFQTNNFLAEGQTLNDHLTQMTELGDQIFSNSEKLLQKKQAWARDLQEVQTLWITRINQEIFLQSNSDIQGILQQASLQSYLLVVLVVLGLIVGFYAVNALIRNLVTPIHQLMHGIQIIGRGIRGYRMHIPSLDEFGRLATSFNQMLQNLEETQISLQKSEARFRTIFEQSSDAIMLLEPQTGRILNFNKMAYQNLGLTHEELFHKNLSDLMAEKSSLLPPAHTSEMIQPVRSEEAYNHKNGMLRHMIRHTSRIFLENEPYLLCILHDVTQQKKLEASNQKWSDTFQSILDNIPAVFYLLDSKGVFLESRGKGLSRIKLQDGDLVGQKMVEAFPQTAPYLREVLKGHSMIWETRGEVDGELWCFMNYLSFNNYKGEGAMGFALDITDRVLAEETLRKLSQAVEQSPASVVITDADGCIEYTNKKFEEVTGYSQTEVMGKNPRILKSGHMPSEIYQELWQTLHLGKEWRGELYNRKKNGELYWEYASISPIKSDDGRITHYLALKEDITLRKEYEKRLLHQANFDSLTGLPNRILALDRLSQALRKAKRSDQQTVILFIDLDNFKTINDTLGHPIGDQLLKEAGNRLKSIVRENDTIARLGGDEFLAILPDFDTVPQVERIAQKILQKLSTPFAISSHEIFVTTSIGLTVAPSDGTDPQTLLRNADAAMYQAKAMGKNTYRFFTQEMNRAALQRMELESQLRQALARESFTLEYQPIFDLRSHQLVGMEALLRWDSPYLGRIPPGQFIPLAEDTGLIIPIGEWVIKTACYQARRWQARFGIPLRLALNISSRQFRRGRLYETLTQEIQESGLSPYHLELEITEGTLLEDRHQTYAMLQDLNSQGIRLSIDDFGTGYSSLSYLKKFPFQTLKIDRSFIHDIPHDKEDMEIVKAIIAIGHNLGLEVIGEGIETPSQLEWLRQEGCDHGQGFYLGEPLPTTAFHELLIKTTASTS